MDIINKENITYDEKKNRSRGDNWTQEEKNIFMEIMRQSAPIIENKQTDTNSNKKKNLEWLKIQNKLKELTGKSRDVTQLKGFWRRAKLAAKKSVTQHRRALQTTGGGQRPPSPPADDLKIIELCPTDFVVEDNKYDSDAVSQFTGQSNTTLSVDGESLKNAIYELDVFENTENVENEMEVSFINESDTIADACNNETEIKYHGKCDKVTHTPDLKKKKVDKNGTSKAALYESNLLLKKQSMAFMEEEFKLKIEYQKQEICHQQLRHKLEIDVLMLEKEKIVLEIEELKKIE